MDPRDVRMSIDDLKDINVLVNYTNSDVQSIFLDNECSRSNQMPEDGSTNWNASVSYSFSSSMDHMDVLTSIDDVRDINIHVNIINSEVQFITIINETSESLHNHSNQMPEGGSIDSRFVRMWIDDLGDFNIQVNIIDTEVQLINIINKIRAPLCNCSSQMPEDGSTNWGASSSSMDPRHVRMSRDVLRTINIGVSIDDSEVQSIHMSNTIGESLRNRSNQMLEDGSTNWELPPRFDESPDEADDADDEAVRDYVADLPLENLVVEDDVANLPQEAHFVEDYVANLQQGCPICVTNARGMAFLCGHTTCGMWGKIGHMSLLPGSDQCPYQVVFGVTMPRELF